MKRISRFFGVIFIVCCLLAVGSGGGVEAQRGESWQYFPDTGHSVSGEFWVYYQSVPNAALVFGAPITEQFTDRVSGRLVQYFQRARFEYFPEKPHGQQVVLSVLGPKVYANTPPAGAPNPINPIGCRKYPKTGFLLCFAFLDFYDRNGGEAIFGQPISAFVSYNDRIVQYFERARFDWYPEKPEGQKVVLAQLGRSYFDLVPEDPARLLPVRVDNTLGDIKSIQTRIFTWKTLTQTNDQQAIYVVVQDQTLNPVEGATVVITIEWARGEKQSFSQTTNSGGVVILPIPVRDQIHGSLIIIKGDVRFSGFSAKSITSFRIWQ